MALAAPWKGNNPQGSFGNLEKKAAPIAIYRVLVGWYDFCIHVNLFNYNFYKHLRNKA
jgi:hypothetical protein